MDKPKKPMSAFLLWLNDSRASIKSENPNLKVTEVAKIGGAMWREMGDKTKWEKQAQKLKADYDKIMETYNAENNVVKGKKRGKPAAAVEPAKAVAKKGRKAPAQELSEEEEDESD